MDWRMRHLVRGRIQGAVAGYLTAGAVLFWAYSGAGVEYPLWLAPWWIATWLPRVVVAGFILRRMHG